MKREQLKEWLAKSRRAVFFGGAGVSTESGIPDFRSENGIYRTRKQYGVSPEEILSHALTALSPRISMVCTRRREAIECGNFTDRY